MENFGFSLLPKIPSDLPLPLTRRRLARFNMSANGTPPPGPSAFTKTRPPWKAKSSGLRFWNGDPRVPVATCINELIALSAAAKTAGTTDAVAHIDLGLVQDAEPNRIHLELIGQLVHR